ncbi:hypothetical protein T4D_11742 [Trichinella pseudospiralis]|uniref:Uncharacterized protein n=1 Tax=Trichinella pseudospiralis TaxID=6337 RepID=A0A0V1FHB3_TRIPS|nr:hypothetical protein T4D_11742 [Trichinella pseudospiralis]
MVVARYCVNQSMFCLNSNKQFHHSTSSQSKRETRASAEYNTFQYIQDFQSSPTFEVQKTCN